MVVAITGDDPSLFPNIGGSATHLLKRLSRSPTRNAFRGRLARLYHHVAARM